MKKYFIAVCIVCMLAPLLRSQAFADDVSLNAGVRLASAPSLVVTCETVDTLFVDPRGDQYLGSPFVMKVTITNTGSEAVSEVEASLLLLSPALRAAGQLSKEIGLIEPQTSREVLWEIMAVPQQTAIDADILVLVSSANHPTIECQSRVHLTALPLPELDVRCSVEPSDTLRYNERTGRFELSELRMKASVLNMGDGTARRVRATLLLPEFMVLAEKESAIKNVLPSDLDKDQTGSVVWNVEPMRVIGHPGWIEFEVLVVPENGSPVKCKHKVYLQPVSRHVLLAMPENSILRHGVESIISIRIEGAEGLDLSKYDLNIKYDPGLLRVKGIETAGTLTADGWSTKLSVSGVGSPLSFGDSTITILAQGPAIVADEGVLLNLRVEGILYSQHGAGSFRYSRLKMDTVRSLLEHGWISFSAVDGGVYVTDDCLEPLTLNPAWQLRQNRPNPFNPTTVIEYRLSEASHVLLGVYDVHGRLLRTLVDELRNAGSHELTFDASDLPSGMYFYRLEHARGVEMKKMLLLR
ncbi:MAG: T9SS type A sorting domain-containing protein [Bacteroidia bacterium]|nr:T9SS type A sorting domain-containing protein [Bacteroidia bacterium]